MSSTIDDILNASDSDGDVDTLQVDLETLLHDDNDSDSDDLNMKYTGANKQSQGSGNSSHIGNRTEVNTFKKVEPIAELYAALEQNDMTAINTLNQENKSLHDANNNFKNIKIDLKNDSDSDSDQNDLENLTSVNANSNTSLLGGLQMARKREDRNILGGNRDVVSALYAKLIRDGGSNVTLSHIKINELEQVSKQLKRNSQYQQHGPGNALVIYVHLKFIAIGTSRGLILLFDHFQEIRQVIGSNAMTAAQTIKTNAGVSAIDSTPSAEIIAAGYENGEILLWDVAKGIVLKRLTELHRTKILRLRFIHNIGDGNSSSSSTLTSGVVSNLLNSNPNSINSNDLSIVTVDVEGVVHRVRFTKVIWTSYTIDSDCLLDGKTGHVIDLNVLNTVLQLSKYQNAALNLVNAHAAANRGGSTKTFINTPPNVVMFPLHFSTQWVTFSTSSRTYIVQVQPGIKILHRWSPPSSAKELLKSKTIDGSTDHKSLCTVCLDWTWYPLYGNADLSKDSPVEIPAENNSLSVRVYPVLMRTWGKNISILTCRPTKQDNDQSAATNNTPSIVDDVTFVSISEREIDEVILMAKWLSVDELKVVIITFTHILIIDCHSPQMEIIESLTLYASISTSFLELFKEISPVEDLLTLCCCSNDSIFLLTRVALFSFTLQSWVEQVNNFISEGKWLDALAKVLQEHKKKNFQDDLLFNTNAIDNEMSRNSETNVMLMEPEEEYLDPKSLKENEVIDNFVKNFVEYTINKASSSVGNLSVSLGVSGLGTSSVRNQYHIVAGVCIEYCIIANRLKYLFGDVFGIFVNVKQESHFLDALEPFILNRRIRWLPPKIIGALFELSARSHRLPALERLIVHLDLFYNVDIHFVIKFLYSNKMSAAYLYAYATGLGDCAGAFHSLFSARLLTSEGDTTVKNVASSIDSVDTIATAVGYPSSEQAEVGYRLLLFLEYVADGKIYPRGQIISPRPSMDILWRLLELLVSEEYLPRYSVSFADTKNASEKVVFSLEKEPYPYLYALYKVDTNALFYILAHSLQIMSEHSEPHLKRSSPNNIKSDQSEHRLDCSVAYILHHIFQFVLRVSNVIKASYEVIQRPFFEQCLSNIILCREGLSHDILKNTIKHIYTHVKPLLSAECLASELAAAQSKLYSPTQFNNAPKPQDSETLPPLRGMLEESKFYRAALRINYWKHRLGGGARVFGSGLRFYLTSASTSRIGGTTSMREQSGPSDSVDLLKPTGNETPTEKLLYHAKLNFGTQLDQPFLFIDDQFKVLYVEEAETSILTQYAAVVIGALSDLYELDRERTRLVCRNHLAPYVSDMCENLKRFPSLLFDMLSVVFLMAASLEGEQSLSSGRRTSIILSNTSEDNRRGSMVNQSAPETIGSGISQYFNPSSMLVYLKLVATLQPRSLYGVLSSTDSYSLDDAIVLCRERRVFDASSYLLERVGDDNGALDVALNEFSNCNSKFNNDVTLLVQKLFHNGKSFFSSAAVFNNELISFKKSMAASLQAAESLIVSNSMLSLSSLSDKVSTSTITSASMKSIASTAALNSLGDVSDIIVNLQTYKDSMYALNFSIKLCFSHSSKTDNSMWFKVLDHILQERAKIHVLAGNDNKKGKDSIVQNNLREEIVVSELIISYLGELMQYMMSKMLAAGVSPQDIVRRITQEQAMRGSRFSEFKEVLIGMVESLSFEQSMYEAVVKLHSQDLIALQKNQIKSKRRGWRYDPRNPEDVPKQDESSMENADVDKTADLSSSTKINNIRVIVDNITKIQCAKERVARVLNTVSSGDTGFGLVVSPPLNTESIIRNVAMISRRVPGTLPYQAQFSATLDEGILGM